MEGFDGDIYVVSEDFRLQSVNRPLAEKLDRHADGERCYEALHKRQAICPFCVHEQVFNGETVRVEIKNPENNCWYYSVNAPIHHVDRSISLLAIYLPPLRNRKSDRPLLIHHFMTLYGNKRNVPPMTAKMMQRLMDHDWPGNVRELQNVVIRYRQSGRIDLLESLRSPFAPPDPEETVDPPDGRTLRAAMADYKKKVIEGALNQQRWHRGKAAQRLGVDRKTLFSKMKRHGLIS